MKKLNLLVILFCCFINTISAVNSPANINNEVEKLLIENSYGIENVNDFLQLTPKEIEKRTGEKLKLKEIIALKAAQRKVKKLLKSDSNASNGTPKSQVVALILVIFIGALGIHRFYLGYVGIGIIQLLTLGGCGIWALIDLIMIATGDLKPKGGEYDTTL